MKVDAISGSPVGASCIDIHSYKNEALRAQLYLRWYSCYKLILDAPGTQNTDAHTNNARPDDASRIVS